MLRYLVFISLIITLSACSPAPTPISTPTATNIAIPTPEKPILDATLLSSLSSSMTIRLYVFDTLTINMPAPTSDPSIVVPPTSRRTSSPSAQCPSLGGSAISLIGIGSEEWIRAYLSSGGAVADLEKMLNMEFCRQGCYMKEIMSSKVYHVDVTGDSVPDVLIVSKSGSRYGVHVSLLLYYCSSGQYTGGRVLFSEGYTFGEPDLGILSIQDMNGNGNPEVIFAYEDLSSSETRRCVRTLEWNGNEMVILDNP